MPVVVSNDGKEAESLIQEALGLLESKRKATWVRLYDSTSAGFGRGGNLIPPQPADYIVATDRSVYTLEVKSSIKETSLATCTIKNMFKPSQISGARLWKRAGRQAYCAFYCVTTKRFEVWDMAWIVDAYNAPPRQRKLKGVPIASCTKSELLDILYNTL